MRWFRAGRALLLALFALCGAVGCRDQCKEGSSWCEGSVKNDCQRGGGDFALRDRAEPTKYDCATDHLACFEGSQGAYCGIAEAICKQPGGVCIGGVHADCLPGAEHPSGGVDCESINRHCVLDHDGGSFCSEVAESCDLPQYTLGCFSAKPYWCDHGVWRPVTCGGTDMLCGCADDAGVMQASDAASEPSPLPDDAGSDAGS